MIVLGSEVFYVTGQFLYGSSYDQNENGLVRVPIKLHQAHGVRDQAEKSIAIDDSKTISTKDYNH
jgi:hypothetical protein